VAELGIAAPAQGAAHAIDPRELQELTGQVTLISRWLTLRARWVMIRARWVTLSARWVTLRARWVTLRARWGTLIHSWVTEQVKWLRSLKEWQTEFVGQLTPREFVDTITDDLLGARIFAFTPKGEALSLPKGASRGRRETSRECLEKGGTLGGRN
jgi:hypothetical protein